MDDIVVEIREENDGFSITIGELTWWFDQEEDKTKLVDVFEELGIEANYDAVY